MRLFFIQAAGLVIIKGGEPPLYLITRSVYPLRLDDIQCVRL